MKCAMRSARCLAIMMLAMALVMSGCAGDKSGAPGPLPPVAPGAPVVSSGPLAKPDQSQLLSIEQTASGLLSFGPLEDRWQARQSPDGDRVALVANDRRSLAAYALDGDKPQGEVVLTWGGPGSTDWYADPWTTSGQIGLLGWKDDATLAFVVGEPDPSGKVKDNGIGFWSVDTGSRTAERLAWLAVQGYRDQPQNRWLTADGKAAVIIHWLADTTTGSLSTLVSVADLKTGKVRTFPTSIPIYEPGGMSLYQRTTAGWAIAWQTPDKWGAPAPADVHVLDLRSGDDKVVYQTGKDGVAAGLRWSPDGARLAVFAAEPGEKYTVIKNLDDWTDWVAPKCIVLTADGRTVAKVVAPGDGFSPDAAWSPDGDRLALYGAEVEPLPAPNEYGLSSTANIGPVYVADLTGQVTKVASPPGEHTANLTVMAGYAVDGTLAVTYDWFTGCRTTLVSPALGKIGEWTDLRPVLADGRLIATAGGWVSTGVGMHGLCVVSSSGESTELLPRTWQISEYCVETGDRLSLLSASGSGQGDSFAKRLFVLRPRD